MGEQRKTADWPLIAASQRVDVIADYGERRDALDQRWAALLTAAQCLLQPIPNDQATAAALLSRHQPQGLLLTGGNSPIDYGGTAPERDHIDKLLLDYAIAKQLPLLGVCRGMQSIMLYFGGRLQGVTGHRAVYHGLTSGKETVNSYHELGAVQTPEPLMVLARSADGVVEAIKHKTLPIYGLMWHPERENPFRVTDTTLLYKIFREEGGIL